MNGLGVLERMGELARSGQTFALATVVWRQGPSSSKQGSRAIITADGQLDGWIGGACAEPVVIREAKQVMADGNARLLLLGAPDQFGTAVPEGMTVVPISCQSEGALEIYIEPVLPVPHLVIVGSSPMAHTLAELARALGWRTDLVSTAGLHGRGSARRAVDGHRRHPGPRRRGHDRARGRACARPTWAWSRPAAAARPCSATSPSGACRRTSWTGCTRPPGWTSAGRRHEEMAVAILAELVQLRASGALADVPAPRAELRPGTRRSRAASWPRRSTRSAG